MKKIYFFLFLNVLFNQSFAQPWNMNTSGTQTITVADNTSGFFYDNGGPSGNYSTNIDGSIMFCPNDPTNYSIVVEFNNMFIEDDFLCDDDWFAWQTDGTMANSGNYDDFECGDDGTNSLPADNPVISSAINGCVSFYFTTDGSDQFAGWEAVVYSIPKPSSSCAEPNPLCADGLGISYAANTIGTAEAGNNYGCLTTQPRPSWFYFVIDQAGAVDLDLNNSVDLDFALWGPFNNVTDATNNCGSLGAPLDCSYSATASPEVISIANALPGEAYILLVTAYSATPTTFTITEGAANTATTNCDILTCDAAINETTAPSNFSYCFSTTPDNTTVASGSGIVFTFDAGGSATANAGVAYVEICGTYDPLADTTPGDPTTNPNYTGFLVDDNFTYQSSSFIGEDPYEGCSFITLVPITHIDVDAISGDFIIDPTCFATGSPFVIDFIAAVQGTMDSTICNGETFVFNGTTYGNGNLSGVDTLVDQASNGCDSVVTVTVTELAPITGTFDTTICNGASFVYNGTTYDNSNLTGTETFTASNDCDSVVTVTVTELAPITGTFDTTICNGASFVYNGTTYDNSNLTGTETFTASNDCDSVVTVTVTILPNETATDVQSACNSYTWIDGATYAASNNSATFVVSGVGGECDTTYTLDLTILPNETATDVQSACNSYTWIDGTTYAASNNSATFVVSGVGGECDTTYTLDLTILPNETATDVQSACNSYTWIDGATYAASNNSATFVVSGVGGECDTTYTLDLTILPNETATDVQSACNSYTWIDGTTYAASNNSATFVVSGVGGECDTTYTLDLTILPNETATDVQSACNSYTWIDGATYAASNNSATFVVSGVGGECDTTYTLDLTILPNETATDVQSACNSYTWIDGTTYAASNNSATFVVNGVGGECDTTYTLDLTILPNETATDVQSACNSYTWIDGTTYAASNNTATFVVNGVGGDCDTTYTLDLTILPNETATDVQSACNSYTWIDGTTYAASNNSATFVVSGVGGECDTTYTLDLTILPNETATDVQSACNSYTWIDGATYAASNNSATFVVSGVGGECDTTYTLDLTILPNETATDVQSACNSYTWIDGTTYAASNNSATFVVSGVGGECDTTYTLDLTILPNETATDVQSACNSYTWIDGATYAASNNSATFVVSGVGGECDTTYTLDLTILPNETATDVQSACNSYTWIDGTTYAASNNSATFVVSGVGGECDTTYTLDLTILPNETATDVQSACNSYTWIDGTTYAASNNTATFVVNGVGGDCDTTYTLDLTILPNETATDVQSACNSYTWIDGTTYAASNNTATFVVNGVGGDCDTTYTLDLTILPNETATDVQSACNSYTWIDGTTYAASNNTATFVVNGVGGECDTTYTLDLTILPNETATDVQSACNSYTWIDGATYAASNNSATFVVNGVGGECDTTYTLDLTILPNETATDVQSACNSYTWIDGATYAASNNTATFVVNGVGGECDTTYTLDLTILPNETATDVQSACNSYTWIDGTTYAASNNTATFVVNGVGGECDTTYTLDLTILPNETATDVQSACNSYTWIDGATYAASNNSATFVVNGVGGECDTTYTLDLTILPNETATDVQSACNSYTWIDGTTYAASNNTATFVVNGVGGECDTTYTLDLTILPNETATDVQSACNSYTWIDGTTYAASNNSATFFVNGVGGECDTTYTLDLTILPNETATDVQSACNSYTWIDGTTYAASNNSATFVVNGVGGECDTTYTLDLTILPNETATDVQSACNSYIWIDGATYAASNNTATFVVNGVGGECDTTYTLDLTILPNETATDVQSACNSYTWIDGATYAASNNSATFVVSGVGGECDTTYTLDLTILPNETATDVQSACNSYTWIDGTTYAASNNSATFVVNGVGGECDTTYTLDLTILPNETATDVQSACNSYTWIDGVTYAASNNTATFTYTAANGCDSVVTLDLTISNPFDLNDIIGGNTTVCQNSNFLLEAENIANSTYFWEGPNGFTSNNSSVYVANANPSNTGMYTLYVNTGGCFSDTISTEVTLLNSSSISISSDAIIYPENETVVLTASGGIAYQWVPIDNIDNPNSALVSLEGLSPGTYTYTVYGMDLNTCLDTASISFEIVPSETLLVYNVISPNNDGFNDTWFVGYLDNLDSYVIRIFDRGGMQLYEIFNNYNNDWNGTYEGTDLPEGPYYYIIETEEKDYKGGITIIR